MCLGTTNYYSHAWQTTRFHYPVTGVKVGRERTTPRIPGLTPSAVCALGEAAYPLQSPISLFAKW